MEKDLDRHEAMLSKHDDRIGRLEVGQAVLVDNMDVLKKIGIAAVLLLGTLVGTNLYSIITGAG